MIRSSGPTGPYDGGVGDHPFGMGAVLIGRYEISELPATPTGAVKAFDRLLRRKVDVAYVERHDQPASLREFRRAAASACRLDVRGAWRPLDFGDHNGVPFLIVEELSGTPLRNEVGINSSVLLVRTGEMVSGLCETLRAAHELGFVHGHLHPGTVLVGEEGPLITGLGIPPPGRSLRPEDPAFAFISPEVRAGATPRETSDVYSIGALTHLMLTGVPPSDPAAPPSQLNSDIPAHWDAVVIRALARDAVERFQSAAELSLELESATTIDTELVREQHVEERDETLEVAAALETKRGRRLVAYGLVILAFAGVIGALGFLINSLLSSPQEVVAVPRVEGRQMQQALTAIEQAGLVSEIAGEEFSEYVPAGHVLTQFPIDGLRVRVGSKVRLVISKGPAPEAEG